MGRQLDDAQFDPENDEWVGTRPAWDSHPTLDAQGPSGHRGARTPSRQQTAPPISPDDFRMVFDRLDKGGLSMTYDRCLKELHADGQTHLDLDHVSLVAELTDIRASSTEWVKVPAKTRKLGASLGERRRKRRTRKRR
jgi:hypothetical protein